jgi:pimeloyl-ACP methyl ester carboxylesterase
MLRANTGLPVRENGVALASLLQGLVAHWPTAIDRVALVGHSQGGLVMRAAASVSSPDDTRTGLVSDVVTLGTPHYGAPLAAFAGWGSRALGVLPESAAFGRVVDQRSAGILDLVLGLGEEVPVLPFARYRLVAATLAADRRHPLSRLLGDLLVRPDSACGRDPVGRTLFPGGEVLHVGGTDHFGLLNHPDVHAALTRWLG